MVINSFVRNIRYFAAGGVNVFLIKIQRSDVGDGLMLSSVLLLSVHNLYKHTPWLQGLVVSIENS